MKYTEVKDQIIFIMASALKRYAVVNTTNALKTINVILN